MKAFAVSFCLVFAMSTVKAKIGVEGFEGGRVSFQCSHRFASTNKKYLCKNDCKDQADILLTVEPGEIVGSERLSLKDSGNGTFTVTFSKLKLTDSGRYWCGVERTGKDTYTAVHLTIKEAVSIETTSGFTPTRRYQNTSNTTPIINPGIDSSNPKNISEVTASNSTEAGKKNSTGTVVYITVSAAAAFVFAVLVLATWFRKHRKTLQHQPQVCSSGAGLICAHNREAQREVHKNGAEMKKISKRFSLTHKQHPPAALPSAPKRSIPVHIYENWDCNKKPPGSVAASVKNEDDISSDIYIKPLPSAVSEGGAQGATGEHRNKTKNETKKPMESSESKASPVCDSGETSLRSLWFGLDLSGTI